MNGSGQTSSNIKPNEFPDQNVIKSPSVPLNQVKCVFFFCQFSSFHMFSTIKNPLSDFFDKKDENNNAQRIIVQQSQVIAHTSPASNGDSLLDQESKPEPMSGIKQTAGIITPKMEPSAYYPAPIATPSHAIKEIKPAVSICNMILLY